jgi:hypothetical protein
MSVAVSYVRDTDHWLFKLSPSEWIRAATAELRRAETAYERRDPRGGLAGAKRAAGMALNGALIVEPNEAWGRTYVDHVAALARDESVPARVREASRELADATPPSPAKLAMLRSAKTDTRVLEATRDVIAHAYAVVARHPDAEGEEGDGGEDAT